MTIRIILSKNGRYIGEDAILGDFRQGLLSQAEAITYMAFLGHEDAGEIVAEWQDELEWEEIEADYRKASKE